VASNLVVHFTWTSSATTPGGTSEAVAASQDPDDEDGDGFMIKREVATLLDLVTPVEFRSAVGWLEGERVDVARHPSLWLPDTRTGLTAKGRPLNEDNRIGTSPSSGDMSHAERHLTCVGSAAALIAGHSRTSCSGLATHPIQQSTSLETWPARSRSASSVPTLPAGRRSDLAATFAACRAGPLASSARLTDFDDPWDGASPESLTSNRANEANDRPSAHPDTNRRQALARAPS
jgi:hypothetical protein